MRLAHARGIEVLALTDHDTVDGLEEAVQAGAREGLTVLRGIELGAKEHRNFHILGYGFSPEDPDLLRLCHSMREGRDERKYRIRDYLRDKGIEISLAEVEELAGGAVIARPHFAQVLVRHGYVASNREAFDRYLDTEEYQRIERPKPEARTCVELLKRAGGRVSLAHPYQLGYDDERLRSTVRQLADWGLDALECHYPKHTPEQTAFYCRLAREFGLRETGGSDFHGERVKPDVELACLELNIEWISKDV